MPFPKTGDILLLVIQIARIESGLRANAAAIVLADRAPSAHGRRRDVIAYLYSRQTTAATVVSVETFGNEGFWTDRYACRKASPRWAARRHGAAGRAEPRQRRHCRRVPREAFLRYLLRWAFSSLH